MAHLIHKVINRLCKLQATREKLTTALKLELGSHGSWLMVGGRS